MSCLDLAPTRAKNLTGLSIKPTSDLEEDLGFAQLEVCIAHDGLTDLAGSRLALLHVRRPDSAQQNPSCIKRTRNAYPLCCA